MHTIYEYKKSDIDLCIFLESQSDKERDIRKDDYEFKKFSNSKSPSNKFSVAKSLFNRLNKIERP